jgi:hypothetical protein
MIPHAKSCPSRHSARRPWCAGIVLRRKISVSAGKSSTSCCEAEGAKRFSVEDAGFHQGEQFDTDAIGG